MSTSSLLRWSGLAAILGGALLALTMLFHPNDADPNAIGLTAWTPVHAVLIGAAILQLFGWVGLYRAQAETIGVLGFIGFALGFTGTALVVPALVVEAFVIPIIAPSAAGSVLLDPNGPLFGGALGILFLLMAVTFSLGAILFGIVTARANVLPRWAGIALLIGGPLLGFTPPLPTLAAQIGAALIGLCFVWAGYRLFAQPRAAMMPAQASA